MTHTTQAQDEVFAFLADPRTHGGRSVKRIDTHGAAVFLAGERALKVKRAVRFPFLDYSTLEKRKAACEAELRVNAVFAPQIYLGLLPVTREASGALALGGEGTAVEWVLEMRRFDENATLDRLAEAGRIDLVLADALGRAVARAHAVAPVVDAAPWIAALAAYIAQNDEAFREFPALFPAAEAAALGTACRHALTGLQPLLHRRGTAGLVRRGHGDLHLGNIVLIEGAPVLFDAIEFDPVVASGDVLYDLAFLLMDLIERKLPAAACTVFNRYLAETARAEDFEGLRALPLFMSLRAAIRAKVTAARLEHASATEIGGIENSARDYFALARRLVVPPAPTLVAIGGLSGTGKSVLARMLAAHIPPPPGAVVLRSDVLRKRISGRAETEKLAADAYSPPATAQVYDELAAQARCVLQAGHSAVVDAVFAKAMERDKMRAVAGAESVAFCGIFLTADLPTRLQRVGARRGDASDADAAVVRRQEEYELGALDWTLVDAGGTPEETLTGARAPLDQ